MINSFWFQLKQFGLLRIFRSGDFLVPALIMVIIERASADVIAFDFDYGQLLDVLVGMFAFVFAALAIMIALSESKFIKAMIQLKTYDKLLFHYWFACNVFLISIGYVLFIDIANVSNKYCQLAAIFVTAYSLCITVSLVKTTISAGLYKARLDESGSDPLFDKQPGEE